VVVSMTAACRLTQWKHAMLLCGLLAKQPLDINIIILCCCHCYYCRQIMWSRLGRRACASHLLRLMVP
jgi:hypothetical protein